MQQTPGRRLTLEPGRSDTLRGSSVHRPSWTGGVDARSRRRSRLASLFRADGVVDPDTLLDNHPGALRHPSWPGGAMAPADFKDPLRELLDQNRKAVASGVVHHRSGFRAHVEAANFQVVGARIQADSRNQLGLSIQVS